MDFRYCAVFTRTKTGISWCVQFIDRHRCHTPYFLEISQEFLKFLMQRDEPVPNDPPFLLELAHYEWVELALDVSEEQLPEAHDEYALSSSVPQLSPLAWLLSYQVPGASDWTPVSAVGRGTAHLPGGLS